MNYEEEQGYYNVMICNKKTKVNFTIHCVDEYDRERTIKQVELYKCFGRDWYVFTDEEEERIIKKLKKEKKENKAPLSRSLLPNKQFKNIIFIQQQCYAILSTFSTLSPAICSVIR